NDLVVFTLGDSNANGVRAPDVRSRDEPRVSRGSPRSGDTERRETGEKHTFSISHPRTQSHARSDLYAQAVILLFIDRRNVAPGKQRDASRRADASFALPAVDPGTGGVREIPLESLQSPEPKTRAEFLQYACRLILDPDTAHRRLCLSEGNTKATLQGSSLPVQDLPVRFDGWTQVMCKDALVGDRCYWEVEWRGRGSSVGVAYAALARKGADARAGLGYNALSWSLEVSDTCCSAMHNNEKQDITVSYSPRVGIYLDRKAGKLAFHSVADNMLLLHVFYATFVDALYPVFGVGCGVGVGLDFALGQFSTLSDSVKICPL
ncbi:hypothetical protein Z043_108487, partial [Scleropages formosus]